LSRIRRKKFLKVLSSFFYATLLLDEKEAPLSGERGSSSGASCQINKSVLNKEKK